MNIPLASRFCSTKKNQIMNEQMPYCYKGQITSAVSPCVRAIIKSEGLYWLGQLYSNLAKWDTMDFTGPW